MHSRTSHAYEANIAFARQFQHMTEANFPIHVVLIIARNIWKYWFVEKYMYLEKLLKLHSDEKYDVMPNNSVSFNCLVR